MNKFYDLSFLFHHIPVNCLSPATTAKYHKVVRKYLVEEGSFHDGDIVYIDSVGKHPKEFGRVIDDGKNFIVENPQVDPEKDKVLFYEIEEFLSDNPELEIKLFY
jgi:hypothetical protein